MKLITDKKALDKAIASLVRRGKKYDQDVQQAALSVIHHVDKHGDVTVANTLIDALPKGSRSNALRAYLETFGKMTHVTAAKDRPAQMIFDRKKETDMDGAMAIQWTDFKPEPVYKPVDISASLTALIKRIDKGATEHGAKYNAKHVAVVKKALESIEAG